MNIVGIITIYDNSNFGNRLQNYATQQIIKNIGLKSVTLKNLARCNEKNNSIIGYIKNDILFVMKIMQNKFNEGNRQKIFKLFNDKYINLSKYYITANNSDKVCKNFNYFITRK